jgi:hypothetical protein
MNNGRNAAALLMIVADKERKVKINKFGAWRQKVQLRMFPHDNKVTRLHCDFVWADCWKLA